MRFSLDFMLGFLGARLGVGLFMDVIMVHWHCNQKTSFCVSSYRHTNCAIDITFELLRQSDEPYLLKAGHGLAGLQPVAASELYLPVSLVCLTFVGPPIRRISISQWVDHSQGAIPSQQKQSLKLSICQRRVFNLFSSINCACWS
jgi:hypothetical protein